MKIFDLLESLLAIPAVSGNEMASNQNPLLMHFPFYSEAKIDAVGNILLKRNGHGENKKKILFEAHRDTVGLIIDEILDGGFASVISSGGIDARILPGTELIVHGKKMYRAIASSVPPHLMGKKEKNEKTKIKDILIDLPFQSKSEAEKNIARGSIVTYAAKAKMMENGRIVSPYLDNFASVIALLNAYELNVKPYHDLYFLFSVGEETTSRGVRTFLGDNVLDVAFVFDAGFGYEGGMQKSGCIQMGKGPSVSFTDTLSRELEMFLQSAAKQASIPLQVVAEPGGTGTSATAIQPLAGGVPSCVISLPVFNMHTPSEIVCKADIISAANIVALLANEIQLPCGEVHYV